MVPFDVTAYLAERRRLVDRALTEFFPEEAAPWQGLAEAMRYSLLAGGKRIRSILALAACEAVSGDYRPALPTACGLEAIHTYSLIHDDLPAMDDDDLRRGQPTCHKKFNEATAILAGDALLTEAFDLIAREGRKAGTDPAQLLDVMADIARAAGLKGMAGGQFIDLASEGKQISYADLETLHQAKTGRLIEVSVVAGAKIGGARESSLKALSTYGTKIGLAFQIADDLLDETGGVEELGKSVGSDRVHAKATYPSLLGIERSREIAHQLTREAVKALSPLGTQGEALAAIARFIIERRN